MNEINNEKKMKRLSILISCISYVVFGLIVSPIYIPCAKAADINVPDDYSTIQEAIDAVSDGDVVIVGLGTYVENINFLGKTITVKSIDPADPDVVAATIIDGNQADSVVTFDNGEENDSVLNGVTVQNGKSAIGGGIVCQSTSPTIINCTITHNSAGYKDYGSGGGIYSNSGSPTIINCTITHNSVGGTGYHCDGGGICSHSGSPTIINCTITDNATSGSGGGFFSGCYSGIDNISRPSFSMTNCVIARNSASEGGGIYCVGYGLHLDLVLPLPSLPLPKPRITNCTITDNSAGRGGAIFNDLYSLPIITNSILWGNFPDEVHKEIKLFNFGYDVGISPIISYSNVEERYFGRHNINTAPLFVDSEAGDYHLQPDSPCIGKGKYRCDMGAYGTYEARVPRRFLRNYRLRSK